jgi:hypothetical protein
VKSIVILYPYAEEHVHAMLEENLVGTRVEDLRANFFHSPDCLYVLYRADSSVILNIRVWAEHEPPFRHCAFNAVLQFEKGLCVAVANVRRISFGA